MCLDCKISYIFNVCVKINLLTIYVTQFHSTIKTGVKYFPNKKPIISAHFQRGGEGEKECALCTLYN